MNANVYLDKENNEVARGLASDVVCTLVQPISGQDRGGLNVTTNYMFPSVDLENQLKNKKIDTCWANDAKQKRNSTRVQACQSA